MANNDTQERNIWREVLIFFALAYAISWSAYYFLVYIANQAGLSGAGELFEMAETTFSLSTISDRLILPVPVVYILTRIVDFGPTIAGLLAALILGGVAGLRKLVGQLTRWRVRLNWYLVAFLLPPVLIVIAIVIFTQLDDVSLSANWQGLSSIGNLLFWVLVGRMLLGGGLGEELGWRGFALPRLQQQYSPVWATLIIGVVWTLWHLPGNLASSSPGINFIAQLLLTVSLSFVFTWVYNGTKGSALLVTLMHGAFNGFNTFFERQLFPVLLDEDGWLIIYILLLVVVGVVMAFLIRRQEPVRVEGEA